MSAENTRTCPKCAMAIPQGFPEGLCPKCLLTGGTPAEPPLPDEAADIDRTLFVEAPTPSQLQRPAGIPSVEVLRRLFPDLEILDLLGAGGMGAVYKARQPRLNRLVALKIMVCPPGHAADFALRFEREAQVLARLNHPHIVTIHDFGDIPPERTGDDPLFYFLMEYVDGTDLGQLIKSKELKPAQALAIVPQICDALQYAHDQGITHRDVKPANILLDQRGTVKIADFGLAKMGGGSMEEAMMTGLTQTGTAMGTPHYMAPEQWEHPESVDHRADIYALGVVFYEMLTGERPAGVFEPPSKCSPVDKKLDGVVMRAMEKNPDRRYQKASEIGDDVSRISGANPRKSKTDVSMAEPAPGKLTPVLALGTAAALAIGGWALWPEEDEKADGSARPPATAAPQATFTFGSSRYALVNEGHTWPEARKLAEARGGRLAVFETEAEESAVREHVRPYLESQMYWIGGFAEEGSRNIRWLNDQPVGSASWARGHPGWRTDAASPEVQTLGRQLCSVGVSIIKNKEEPGRWIHVTSQGRNHPGYLIEWDDAASAPPSPVAGGPSTLPSHEWVKVDWVGQNTWRDNEFCRLLRAEELARDGGLKLTANEQWMSNRVPGFSKLQNGGIRLRWKSTVDSPEGKANLMVSPRGNFKCSVNVSVKTGAVVQYGGHGDEFKLGNIPHGGLPPLDKEMDVEITYVGRLLILKRDGVLQGTLELPETAPPAYPQFRGNNVVVTEASVINLDGLSEAEALKVLGVESVVPTIAAAPDSAAGPPAALPSKPGRLRAAGTAADGKPHDLAKFAAYDDFVDVAGGWSRWVALRANGQTVSSDGMADFTDIAKIAASFNAEYALISKTGKLVIPAYEAWKLPAGLEKGVLDAALGLQHGIALLEGGRAVVFGARYEGVVGDPTDPKQYGTPRWPMPEAHALEKVKAVAATVTHAATLHEDGSLSLWGWEGPLKWQADPGQKTLRQLRSSDDGFWALDEAGQLWHLPVPRNPAPGQSIHVTGKPSLREKGVTHMRERCWRRKSGEWIAHLNTTHGMALLKDAGITETTAFSLNGGTLDDKPFASLLWIEPVDAPASTVAKSALSPGRLTGTGTMYYGKPVDLSKTAAYDDFVDVFVNNAY